MEPSEIFAVYEHIVTALKHVRVVNRTGYSITTQLDSKDGLGIIRLYALFPGILLAFNDLSIGSYSCPPQNGEAGEGLKMNFCIEGRCEVKMPDDKYLFLEAGDLCIDMRTPRDTFSFPYNRYYGVELLIHHSALKQAPPALFRESGIDMTRICEKYCPNNKNFVGKPNEKIKSAFLNITESVHECELSYFRLKTAELLLLLMYLEKPAENECRTFLTMGQINIAKQVMNIITSDLSAHYSINNLARKFSISPTSLKNYFQGVYGQNISAYLRGKRMNRAAEYLEEGDRPVGDIALLTGYENASKFAAVFKLTKGESPLEYRRRRKASV
jgi:AraC-like DNA-binding protein